MSHTCEALVVHCMDFRLQAHLNAWLEKNVAGGYDRLSIAGSGFDAYDVLRHVELSLRLHGIKRVILINHEDCGMYGAAGTRERHEEDLRKLRERVARLFPQLETETYFMRLDGVFEPTS